MTANIWAAIENTPSKKLEALFDEDAQRVDGMTISQSGLRFDFSKTHLDAGLLLAFAELTKAMDIDGAREKLFTGAVVNPTEGRAATHVAERGNGFANDVAQAKALQNRMRGLIEVIEAWDHELTAKINSLEKLPGPRIGYAELVVERLLETAAGATEAMEHDQEILSVKRENAKVACQAALENCHAGGKGFSLFIADLVRKHCSSSKLGDDFAN